MKNYTQKMRYAAAAFGRGVRVMNAVDIGRIRNEAQEVRGRISAARDTLAAHALEGTGTAEELQALRTQIAQDTQRYTDLMGAVQNEEEAARTRVAAQFNSRRNGESMQAHRGAYYHAVMTGAALTAATVMALSVPQTIGANPGNGLLPVTVSDQLIDDIYDDGAFLSAITVTNIPGLRLPKATTTETKTDAALEDGADATTHEMDDDTIMFGAFPGRDAIVVPTSVLESTHVQLAGYVEGKLQEFHRERMYRRMFATAATGNYAHMSVYNAEVGIKTVTGATMYDAIKNALAALPTAARRVAKVAMTATAYLDMIKELANSAAPLFGAHPEEFLGFEVAFCDNATDPIVGDLKTIHVNYNNTMKIEVDKSAVKGTTTPVLSADYDIQVEDANRLRKATVA